MKHFRPSYDDNPRAFLKGVREEAEALGANIEHYCETRTVNGNRVLKELFLAQVVDGITKIPSEWLDVSELEPDDAAITDVARTSMLAQLTLNRDHIADSIGNKLFTDTAGKQLLRTTKGLYDKVITAIDPERARSQQDGMVMA